MTFPVHRSEERTPRERGEAFGRAQADADREHARPLPADVRGDARHRRRARRARASGSPPEAARRSPGSRPARSVTSSSCAPSTRAPRSSPARARPSARSSAPAACSRRTGTGIRTPRPATVIWIVEHEHGWFVTLTEAGILAKIGLNDAGLGVCLNLLDTTADGGLDGTPIHLLLRQVLETLPQRRRRDRAAHRTRRPARARRSPSPRPATSPASSSPPAARTSSAAASAPTPTTSSSRRARAATPCPRSRRARSRAWRSSAASRCSTRCAPTRPPEGRLPPRRPERALGGADGDRRVGRDEPRGAPLPRRGGPALHARARADRYAGSS